MTTRTTPSERTGLTAEERERSERLRITTIQLRRALRTYGLLTDSMIEKIGVLREGDLHDHPRGPSPELAEGHWTVATCHDTEGKAWDAVDILRRAGYSFVSVSPPTHDDAGERGAAIERAAREFVRRYFTVTMDDVDEAAMALRDALAAPMPARGGTEGE